MDQRYSYRSIEESYPLPSYSASLCYQAVDLLESCIEKKPNHNSYYCLNEMYSYNTHCPKRFQKHNKINNMIATAALATFTSEEIRRYNKIRNVVYQTDLRGNIKI